MYSISILFIGFCLIVNSNAQSLGAAASACSGPFNTLANCANSAGSYLNVAAITNSLIQYYNSTGCGSPVSIVSALQGSLGNCPSDLWSAYTSQMQTCVSVNQNNITGIPINISAFDWQLISAAIGSLTNAAWYRTIALLGTQNWISTIFYITNGVGNYLCPTNSARANTTLNCVSTAKSNALIQFQAHAQALNTCYANLGACNVVFQILETYMFNCDTSISKLAIVLNAPNCNSNQALVTAGVPPLIVQNYGWCDAHNQNVSANFEGWWKNSIYGALTFSL